MCIVCTGSEGNKGAKSETLYQQKYINSREGKCPSCRTRCNQWAIRKTVYFCQNQLKWWGPEDMSRAACLK